MRTTTRLMVAVLLSGAALAAHAQSARLSDAPGLRGLTASQLGDMSGYPYGVASAAAPRDQGPEDPRMRGDMADHPHLPVTPGSQRPMSRDKEDPRMRGDMGDHPHQGR